MKQLDSMKFAENHWALVHRLHGAKPPPPPPPHRKPKQLTELSPGCSVPGGLLALIKEVVEQLVFFPSSVVENFVLLSKKFMNAF